MNELQSQRRFRQNFVPGLYIPDERISYDEIMELVETQSRINSIINQAIQDYRVNGAVDFLSIIDALDDLGDDYLDDVYENLVSCYFTP